MSVLDCSTLTLIQKTAQDAVAAQLKPMPNDPERHLLIKNDKYEIIETPFAPSPRVHTVASIEDLAKAYARWFYEGLEEVGPEVGTDADADAVPLMRKANIWLDLDQWRTLFFTDEPLRRGRIVLPLTPAPQWLTVVGLQEGKSLDQKSLVRMLRHDLFDCVPSELVTVFRSVSFQKIEQARGNIQHGTQTFDQDLTAAVLNSGVPEDFTVEVPVFASKELQTCQVHVTVTIDIDCANKRFFLQTVPGHVELALDEAREFVTGALGGHLAAHKQSDAVVIAGNPGN